MADTAFQTRYRDEFIETFEQHQSLLRDTVITEADVNGNQAVFLVAGSGDADAVTRGVNGMIPARPDDLTQNTAILQEWHDLVRKTRFNIYASQGNQRAIMQKTTMGVLNRRIDQDILGELANATQDTGAAQTASLALVVRAKVILGNNKVPNDGGICAVVSPAFMGYLSMTTEFSSGDYVATKPLVDSGYSFIDAPKLYRWQNINWIEHPELPGVGTASESCYMYHRNAIGHAVDKDAIQSPVGYNEEQDYSWARATAFMGSKLLQNSGVVKMVHDGSAFVAE